MKSVIVTIEPYFGHDISDNFYIFSNVGVPSPDTATREELIAGLIVSVDDLATIITLKCTGLCGNDEKNDIILVIGGTTTTTTTTTLAPTPKPQFERDMKQ